MKKLRILFTAIIITCFASLFCGCKEPDEQGLKHFYPDLILCEDVSGKYELTIEYNGEVQTFSYDMKDSEKDCHIKEYDHYKEVLTEEEYDSKYTFFRMGGFFLELRKNVELKISYIQEINDVKTKYTSTVVIPYVEKDGRYYSGKEDISFVGDNGKTLSGYLVYNMMITSF